MRPPDAGLSLTSGAQSVSAISARRSIGKEMAAHDATPGRRADQVPGAVNDPAPIPNLSGLENLDGAELESMVDSLLEELENSEFYCSIYASKEQPHVEGLLQSLAEGLRALDRNIAVRLASGEAVDDAERARRVLNRLLSSTNRRMHKGFPEMLSYLLGKPSWYCSHRFAHLGFQDVLNKCCLSVQGFVNPLGAGPRSTEGQHRSLLYGSESTTVRPQSIKANGLCVADYIYRSKALEEFPWYFLVSACIPKSSRLPSQSQPPDWKSAQTAGSRPPEGPRSRPSACARG